jgi:hypothetical protein
LTPFLRIFSLKKIALTKLSFLAAPYFGFLRDFGRIVGSQEATQAIAYQKLIIFLKYFIFYY